MSFSALQSAFVVPFAVDLPAMNSVGLLSSEEDVGARSSSVVRQTSSGCLSVVVAPS